MIMWDILDDVIIHGTLRPILKNVKSKDKEFNTL